MGGRLAETHFADWDALGRVTVRSLCGAYIRRREHSEAPTCPVCRQALEVRNTNDARAGRWWEDHNEETR